MFCGEDVAIFAAAQKFKSCDTIFLEGGLNPATEFEVMLFVDMEDCRRAVGEFGSRITEDGESCLIDPEQLAVRSNDKDSIFKRIEDAVKQQYGALQNIPGWPLNAGVGLVDQKHPLCTINSPKECLPTVVIRFPSNDSSLRRTGSGRRLILGKSGFA